MSHLIDSGAEYIKVLDGLDLMSGLNGWSRQRTGWAWTRLDWDKRFGADHQVDILTVKRLEDLERDGRFDLLCASPPCETFSTGSIGKHWTGGKRAYVAGSDAAKRGLKILAHTFALIDSYRDRHPRTLYILENPRCLTHIFTPRPPTTEQWWCHWGERVAKPSHLWTNILIDWPEPCHNNRDHLPTCCCADHDPQSRYHAKRKALGQTGGTQGKKDAAARAVIPERLATTVMLYAEAFAASII